ncbi:hypothetical protein [Periweissella fabalis]|uniref:Uncharacterized protein n=1 Tax=Periweissella fabalis TaxID=1070421 RepID=A0A7X6N1X2_9LACO|nr:hypothetical protein [Periweissella fabalis]MCM0599460.1 hypothetical protein [Periweissella fabalis]NKZ23739.1 hypothetical protein [Periweissella fabalis]
MNQQLLDKQEYLLATQHQQRSRNNDRKQQLEQAKGRNTIKESFPYQIHDAISKQEILVKLIPTNDKQEAIVLSTDLNGLITSEKIALESSEAPTNDILHLFVFMAIHEPSTPMLYRDSFSSILILMAKHDIREKLPNNFFNKLNVKHMVSHRLKDFIQKFNSK